MEISAVHVTYSAIVLWLLYKLVQFHRASPKEKFSDALSTSIRDVRSLDYSEDRKLWIGIQKGMSLFQEHYIASFEQSFCLARIDDMVELRGKMLDHIYRLKWYIPNDVHAELAIDDCWLLLNRTLTVYIKDTVTRWDLASNAEATYPHDDCLFSPVQPYNISTEKHPVLRSLKRCEDV